MSEEKVGYDPARIESKWRREWSKLSTFKWEDGGSKDREVFSVDTPPPTVSGSLHLGHIFSYTQTDLLVRFNRMKGKRIFYPMGWDDNGLPTERRVQNVFGVNCDINLPYNKGWQGRRDKGAKDPVENISRANFIEICSQLTKEDEEVFKNLFQRLALSVDWSLEYATIDERCRRVSQLSFLDLVEKGQVYSVESPTLWDVTFQSAVAQAEVEDREHSGSYHDIKFKVEETGEEFVISTTRPELLPACIAVVAHPDDGRYQKLFGKYAVTPLFNAKVPILPAAHADPEKGSGILMVCTFGDTMDIEWWKQSGLPLKQILGKDGRVMRLNYGEAPFSSLKTEQAARLFAQLHGLTVFSAQKKIVEFLSDGQYGWDGKTPLLAAPARPVTRPVKFYEKGDRPLEFITSRQWFVRILKHKEALVEQADKIEWRPVHMKARFVDWVKGLNQDWCISRQRYFGVPFPVWYQVNDLGETDFDRPLYAKAEQLPVDPMADVPAGYSESQRGKPGGFVGEKDVMDTWATSSLTPQIATGFFEGSKKTLPMPMDLRPQSHEIIRTWAFYTVVKAYLHGAGGIPWSMVAISGWILDPDRKKMSKSKGNVVTPEKFMDDFGGDSVRYWSARARLGVDTAFDENLFKMGRKLCNKLYNAGKFVVGQIGKLRTNSDWSKVVLALDKAWWNRMARLVDEATAAFEKTDYAHALQLTEETFWYFCDHYLELIKVRSYQMDEENKAGRESALETLNMSLGIFLRLFAPFFPYLTEDIYFEQTGTTIHGNGSWPSPMGNGLGNEDQLTLAQEVLAQIRSFKTKNQKNLKWPVKKLVVSGKNERIALLKDIIGDVLLAGNVDRAGLEFLADNAEENISVVVELSEQA